MFEIRLEARYGEKMRKCDIEAARAISAEMNKLANAAYHMHYYNSRNLHSECPNTSRAARNIIRIYNAVYNAYWEVDSLHDCYIAQFTDFDDDGEMIDSLPAFDFSDQSILETEAQNSWIDAQSSLVHAVCDFAKFSGISADYFALLNDDNLRNFIDNFIAPAIIAPKSFHAVVSGKSRTTVYPVFVAVKPVVRVHSRHSKEAAYV